MSSEWTGKFNFNADITKTYKDHQNRMHVVAVVSDTQPDLESDRMSFLSLKKMSSQLSASQLPLLESHNSTFGFGFSDTAVVSKVEGKVWELETNFILKEHWPQSLELFNNINASPQNRIDYQLSIGGRINRDNPDAITFETDKNTGMMIRVINDVILDHVASTRPKGAANPRTGFQYAITKSLDGIEKDNNFAHWHMPDLNENFTKAVIPFNTCPLLEKSCSFSSNAGDKILEMGGWPAYKAAHTWYDSTRGSTPEAKSAYKFLHHEVDGSVVKTIAKGVISAMAAMCGKGVEANVPSGDKSGIVSHLSRHFREFGLTPPTNKELNDMSLKDYVFFINKQGYDFTEESMLQKSLKGIETTSIDDVAVDVLVKELDELETKICDVEKGFTADQVSGKLGASMKKMVAKLNSLMSVLTKPDTDVDTKTDTNKTEVTGKTSSGISKEDMEHIVNEVAKKVAETNSIAMPEIAQKMGESLEISKISNSVEEVGIKLEKTFQVSLGELTKRIETVEKTGGVSQSIPISPSITKEQVVKDNKNPWSGIFDHAVKKACSKVHV